VQRIVDEEIEHELDLSYYMLNNETFFKLLPTIFTDHMMSIKSLDLTGNNLDDDALQVICDRFKSAHNTSLEKLVLD